MARPGRFVAALTLTLLVSGCTGGAGAVALNNGGQFRFVAATPRGELIAAADRGVAPRFDGTLLDGVAFASSSLDGTVAVINFWGQWCAPCRVETPNFQQVYADVQDVGVSFLGVDVKDNDQLARAFLADAGVTYPSLFDPRGEIGLIFRDYPPSAIPSTILLDPSGRVAAVYVGPVSEENLRSAVDRLLAEA